MKEFDPIADLYVCEQTSPIDNTVSSLDVRKAGGDTVARFDTTLQSFDVMNRNGRMYLSDNVWQSIQTEENQTLIRGNRWFGEQDHPFNTTESGKLTPERMRKIYMPNRSHVILNPRIRGNLLLATIESSCNDVGKGFRDEVLRGMVPAFSCRAVARMERRNNKPTIIIGKLITYDWVLFQSHREAEGANNLAQRQIGNNLPVMESVTDTRNVGDVIIPVDALKSVAEKDRNVNYIMESYDISNEGLIGYNSSSKRVIIGDRNTRIYAKLEPESIASIENVLSMF
nr:MAG TPA: Prohead core protein serine protease [Caudoviricetes sp.]